MQEIDSISPQELVQLAGTGAHDFIKGVVDIKNEIIVLDAPLHADEESYLLNQGSEQKDLWGFNLFPSRYGKADFIVYESLINIRPAQNNDALEIKDEALRQTIKTIIMKHIVS